MQKNILEYLFNIIEKKPNSLAFVGEKSALTFNELKDVAFKIGTKIIEYGIINKPILVFMKKSPEEIATFLGIVASGCYYVPIDEEMPEERIKLIIEITQSPLIIADESIQNKINNFENTIQIISYTEAIQTEINELAILDIYQKSIDINPVYILFTSGSTGIPKGIVACHRSIIDYTEQISQALNFSENSIFGNQSPLYFDASLRDIYPTIKFGATTYLISKKLFSQPYILIQFLNEHKINTICWVSSALTLVSSFGTFNEIIPKYLKTIASFGEVFKASQLNKWKKVLPQATFYNLYGPTEITGACCYYKINKTFANNEIIPIGKPFNNREILLLNNNNLVNPGEEGEICVRGSAVTPGYYNNIEQTKNAFIQNPLISAYKDIIYKTGDIGKIDDDGNLIFISRIDHQIKHMGHRIELNEIEINADQIDDSIMSACVFDLEQNKILLYYTGNINKNELFLELKNKLPRYMLPAEIIHIKELPFLSNGKINKIILQKNAKTFEYIE